MRSLLALILVLLAAPSALAQPLPVVASFSILADITRQVGGDAVHVTTLVPPDGDAHTYEPRPADLAAIRDAKLLVLNGMGLEGWMDRLAGAADGGAVRVVASAGVTPRTMLEEGRRITDPHAWQDPRNAVLYVRNIVDALARVDPAHADTYRANAERYSAAIRATDAWIERTLAPIPPARRHIITSHDAFFYYGARYHIDFRGVQGIDTEAEPTPRDIARLAVQIRQDGIRVVFVENMTDPRLAAALAQEANAIVGPKLYSDALSPPGGPAATYLAMLHHNTEAFVDALTKP
jgi:zinc/manganese transport system substrate-binding protein